jgi:hypothetical protein
MSARRKLLPLIIVTLAIKVKITNPAVGDRASPFLGWPAPRHLAA